MSTWFLAQTKPLVWSMCWDWKMGFSSTLYTKSLHIAISESITHWQKEEGNVFCFVFLSFDLCAKAACVSHTRHCRGCQIKCHWKKEKTYFICLCALKCHSFPLIPINWVYNGSEFLSAEPLMNTSKPSYIHWIMMRGVVLFWGKKIFLSDPLREINTYYTDNNVSKRD